MSRQVIWEAQAAGFELATGGYARPSTRTQFMITATTIKVTRVGLLPVKPAACRDRGRGRSRRQ